MGHSDKLVIIGGIEGSLAALSTSSGDSAFHMLHCKECLISCYIKNITHNIQSHQCFILMSVLLKAPFREYVDYRIMAKYPVNTQTTQFIQSRIYPGMKFPACTAVHSVCLLVSNYMIKTTYLSETLIFTVLGCWVLNQHAPYKLCKMWGFTGNHISHWFSHTHLSNTSPWNTNIRNWWTYICHWNRKVVIATALSSPWKLKA